MSLIFLLDMFQISDVMVDKDEVAMSLNIQVSAPDAEPGEPLMSNSKGTIIVSKPHEEIMAQKVLQILALQGIGCAQCPRMTYKLYPLSDDSKGMYERGAVVRRFQMDVLCASGATVYTFEFSTKPMEGEGEFCNGEKEG